LVACRTATIDQIRAFLIEQGIAVRTGPCALRNLLFGDLGKPKGRDRAAYGQADPWSLLDERIETVTGEIEALAQAEAKYSNDAAVSFQSRFRSGSAIQAVVSID
jgi:transposase